MAVVASVILCNQRVANLRVTRFSSDHPASSSITKDHGTYLATSRKNALLNEISARLITKSAASSNRGRNKPLESP